MRAYRNRSSLLISFWSIEEEKMKIGTFDKELS
jgi:hypothetical protein